MPPKLPRTSAALLRESTQAVGAMGENNPIFQRSADAPRIVELDVDQIEADPDQPRRHFDEASLLALADSIEEKGQIQPIVVRPVGDRRYRIAAGERRWRARKLKGHRTVFAIISKAQADEIALVENLQRVDLGPFELAHALKRLGEVHGYTQAQLGRLIGRSQAEISKLLGFLALPEDVLADHEGALGLSRSVIYEIAQAGDPDLQRTLWRMAIGGATAAGIRAAMRNAATAQPAARSVDDPWKAVERGITRMARDLAAVQPSGLSPERRASLVALHRRIEALLSNK
ncbi:MAG: ParB/RepB/Spo0J family partition protein [Alphaproteobacteria bacterium]|nr:ParB/RepB/Spo0J family partition protein [Alphaproteobacteria bacterium]